MSDPPVTTGRVVLFWAIALGGAGFDLATKAAVFSWVGEPDPAAHRTIIPDVLELQTSYNPGALWGFGRDWAHSSQVFAALSVVAGAAIVYWLFVRKAATDLRLTIALALIMAGAVGNCYDRLALGHVRDFVFFHVEPIGFRCAIFNFADNMLIAGALILMLLAIRPERPAADETSPLPTAEAARAS